MESLIRGQIVKENGAKHDPSMVDFACAAHLLCKVRCAGRTCRSPAVSDYANVDFYPQLPRQATDFTGTVQYIASWRVAANHGI